MFCSYANEHAGGFGKLVVVKISDDFQFAARMVDPKLLVKGKGKFGTLLWESMIAGEADQEIHKNFPIKKVEDGGWSTGPDPKRPSGGGTTNSWGHGF